MPITFLAEAAASPSPQALKEWLEVLAYLCGIVAAVAIAWNQLTGRSSKTELGSQPIEVRAAAELVSKREHQSQMEKIEKELGRHAARRSEIYDVQAAQGGDIKALKESVAGTKETVGKLDAKLDANTSLTAKIDGRIDQINQSVHALNTSVTQFMRDQKRH